MNLVELKNDLCIRFPIFGDVVRCVRFRPLNCRTACTDGLTVFYNEKFMDSLTFDEQLFVLAHELLHVAFNHIYRRKDRNPKLWNIATDAIINQFLAIDCKLPMPKGLVDIDYAYGLGAQEVYELLKQKAENQQQNGQGEKGQGQQGQGQGDSSGSSDGSGQQGQGNSSESGDSFDYDVDNHDMWDDPGQYSDDLTEEEKDALKDAIDRAVEKIKDEVTSMSENTDKVDEMNKKIKDNQIIRKQQSGASNSDIKLSSEKLGITKEVPWQKLLDDLIGGKGDYDYTDPKQVKYRHVEDSWMQLPSIKVEIVIDVSGSVSEDLVRNFLMECKGMFSAAESKLEMKIGFFGDSFMAPLEDGTYADKIGNDTITINEASDIDKLNIPEGGGTSFFAALSGFDDMFANKIVFTDGLSDWEHLPSMDAIWIVYGEEPPEINPPGAKGVVYIKGEQFRNLCQVFKYEEQKGMRR